MVRQLRSAVKLAAAKNKLVKKSPDKRKDVLIESHTVKKRIKVHTDQSADVLGEKYDQAEAVKAQRIPPADWEYVLEAIKEMRKNVKAEVDVDGAEIFYDAAYPEHERRFHVLISAMLSSQTKDPVTASAMRRLIAHGLTVQSMIDIDEEVLSQRIYPVGFYRLKAKYIKKTATILMINAQGKEVCDIPETVEDLIALPGIGPKMAYLTMNVAWHKPVGICVDTHVHRISNRLGWVSTWNRKSRSQDPEKTRKELEEWLPREHWSEINHLLVGFGQTICYPRNPKCEDCKAQAKCPSAFSKAF